jgi:hypothetical protein
VGEDHLLREWDSPSRRANLRVGSGVRECVRVQQGRQCGLLAVLQGSDSVGVREGKEVSERDELVVLKFPLLRCAQGRERNDILESGVGRGGAPKRANHGGGGGKRHRRVGARRRGRREGRRDCGGVTVMVLEM